MANIDSNIPNVTDNERAVVAKYDFNAIIDKNKVVTVSDPVLLKAFGLKDASKGRYIAKTLSAALEQAVLDRRAYEDEKAGKNGNGKAATPEPAATKATKPAAKGRALPNKETKTKPATNGDKAATGKKAKATKATKAGKTKKEKKVREPKVRKDNRYLRASKIVADKLDITAEQLSKDANMSKATAGHCLEAWKGVTAVLIEKGWLKLPK